MDWSVKKCKNSEECETADARQGEPNTTQGLYIHQEYMRVISHVCSGGRGGGGGEGGEGSLGRMTQCYQGYEDCAVVCVLSSGVHSAVREEWGQFGSDGQLRKQLVQHTVQQHVRQLLV